MIIRLTDEGYTEEEEITGVSASTAGGPWFNSFTLQQREELVCQVLESMPRSQIAKIYRRIAPCLQFDVVAALPSELSLTIFSYFSAPALLKCALVCKRWRKLADDSALWKKLCLQRGWQWKQPTLQHSPLYPTFEDFDDEGMGDDEETELPAFHEQDSGYISQILDNNFPEVVGLPSTPRIAEHHAVAASKRGRESRQPPSNKTRLNIRHSAPSILPSADPPKPDYKQLHQTRVLLHNRLLNGSYRFLTLQTHNTPNAHSGAIYCLQLYTYPEDGRQVLFTGSKDRTIREWNLTLGVVERVFESVHHGSVLSLCVHGNYIASAGTDKKVCVWDLRDGKLVRKIKDHEDNVLCVRFNDKRLVSCSKDRTIRTYKFPDLRPDKIFYGHRAAVNAVAIVDDNIVSVSGDKSMRLWDAKTGALLKTFEGHHTRGIASIDFQPPFIISGSSDKHVRFFDVTTQHGWSTCSEFHNPTPLAAAQICDACGRGGSNEADSEGESSRLHRKYRPVNKDDEVHSDLVRSVALGSELAVSGSYDKSVKVWDRESGALLADLKDRHEGRIFCVGFDCTKIVSCGEDSKICIWDLSYGIDTSFIML
ncbi:WD40 repeat-like protein [Rickenella mellea]|uniref:WD40 repeat-like protein n=1 Tax=Rickenella mellea TaxID=50990 RepID=A0A4Y7QDG0_9AGAM|nr:WD40 repeat-like protein [Rickenella mellea]